MAPELSLHKYKTMNDIKLAQQLHRCLFFFFFFYFFFVTFSLNRTLRVCMCKISKFLLHIRSIRSRHSAHTRTSSSFFFHRPMHMLVHLSQVGNNGVNCIWSIFLHRYAKTTTSSSPPPSFSLSIFCSKIYILLDEI